eukprot:163203_1
MLNWLDVKDFYLIAISIVSICAIIATCICIATLYHLCIKDSSKWIKKLYSDLTFITILSFTLCCIGDLVHYVIRFIYFPHRFDYDINESTLATIIDAIYYFGNITFYILLLLRVKTVLTPLNIPKCVFYILSILIIIASLSSMAYCIILFSMYNDDNNRHKYIRISVFILSITDFLLNVCLLSLFSYNLKKSIITAEISSDAHQRHVSIITDVLTKHFILFTIAIIANQGYFTWTIYYTSSNDDNTIQGADIFPHILRSLENVINVLVLWLILQINHKQYIRCCKYCHFCVSKCCIKNKELRFRDPYHPMQDLEINH